MSQEILQEEPLSTVDVKEILEKIKKSEGELNFRAQKTYDHLLIAAPMKPAEAKKLEAALTDLGVSRMREQHIKKLVSIVPRTEDEAKMVMSGFNVTVNNDDAKKIAKTCSEYAK